MDPISTNARQVPPALVPDLRPAADAAALASNKTPQIPLPIAPLATSGAAQTAAVIQSMMEAANAASVRASRVEQPERTLKPYGIGMLPKGPVDDPLDKKAPTEAGEMAKEALEEDENAQGLTSTDGAYPQSDQRLAASNDQADLLPELPK